MKGGARVDATGKTVEAFVKGIAPPIRAAVQRLRKLVRAEAPALVEQVKWGNICWVGKSNVCFAAVFRDHVQFGFFAGAKLEDPAGLLQGKGAWVRHLKVRASADVKAQEVGRLLKQAMARDGKSG